MNDRYQSSVPTLRDVGFVIDKTLRALAALCFLSPVLLWVAGALYVRWTKDPSAFGGFGFGAAFSVIIAWPIGGALRLLAWLVRPRDPSLVRPGTLQLFSLQVRKPYRIVMLIGLCLALLSWTLSPSAESKFADGLRARVNEGAEEIPLRAVISDQILDVCLQAFTHERGSRFKEAPWAYQAFVAERGAFNAEDYTVWQLAILRRDGHSEIFEVSRKRVPVLAQTYDQEGAPKAPVLTGNVPCAPLSSAVLRKAPGLNAYMLVDAASRK
jgi:hypothetical protein